MRLFEEANILTRHDFGDGRARYEEMTGDHHDHLIDVQSGRVIEFRNEEIENACSARSPVGSGIRWSAIGSNSTPCRTRKRPAAEAPHDKAKK